MANWSTVKEGAARATNKAIRKTGEVADVAAIYVKIKMAEAKLDGYYTTLERMDSDAEMQSIVGGLEKSVHVVLAEHGYDFKNTPKCTDSKEKKAPESEQRQKEQGSVASESSTSDTKQENKKVKYAKTEKVTKTRVKKKQPSARQKEIQHYLNLVQCYNHKL